MQQAILLCDDLKEVEVQHGKTLGYIAEPTGTNCPYAVVFKKPLKIWGTPAAAGLPAVRQAWECRDSHYSLEAGFFCTVHKHSVAGPLVTN